MCDDSLERLLVGEALVDQLLPQNPSLEPQHPPKIHRFWLADLVRARLLLGVRQLRDLRAQRQEKAVRHRFNALKPLVEPLEARKRTGWSSMSAIVFFLDGNLPSGSDGTITDIRTHVTVASQSALGTAMLK